MNKILEKIKNFFSGKSEKKEEPKPQQEEPKAQEKPKEQKQIGLRQVSILRCGKRFVLGPYQRR